MVFGGFAFTGGALGPVLEAIPHEMLIIGGAGAGALIIGNSPKELKALGLTVLPSQANFLAIGFGRDAKPIHQGLLERGIIVRPIASYDMPYFLRVSIGTEAENDRFLAALKDVLKA